MNLGNTLVISVGLFTPGHLMDNYEGEDRRYKCSVCGYLYKEKDWADKCAQWCRETNSRNLEINQHGTPPELDN